MDLKWFGHFMDFNQIKYELNKLLNKSVQLIKSTAIHSWTKIFENKMFTMLTELLYTWEHWKVDFRANCVSAKLILFCASRRRMKTSVSKTTNWTYSMDIFHWNRNGNKVTIFLTIFLTVFHSLEHRMMEHLLVSCSLMFGVGVKR